MGKVSSQDNQLLYGKEDEKAPMMQRNTNMMVAWLLFSRTVVL
jgi:hypothetical protein